MSDLTKELLKLIKEEKTINQISQTLNLSNKQIYNILTMIKNKGFDFERKYYDTGDIIYVPRTTPITNTQEGTNIITDKSSDTYTAIVVSDMHFGSGFEVEGIMDKIYDYCVKEGIHNIICCGDLLDGTRSQQEQRIPDTMEQIDYLLRNYPFDKNILTFTVLGDHDRSILKGTGQDISFVLNSYRHDIVPLGYRIGNLNIKNDTLTIEHQSNLRKDKINSNLTLRGHYHSSKISYTSNVCKVDIPSLSNLNLYNEDGTTSIIKIPEAYLMKIKFNTNTLSYICLNQLFILDKIYPINETCFQIASKKKGDFNNTEDYSKTILKNHPNLQDLNPHLTLQPPVYVPPTPKNPASLDNIRKKTHKWE